MAFAAFEFNLSDALLAQLVELLNSMEPGPLTLENAAALPEGQGVYQLFHNGQLVYIGKTDSDAGLRQRLGRHVRSIQNRLNLNVQNVTFNAVRIFVFTAMDLETLLIRSYGRPDWNNRGFGSNDPGRRRDRTRLKPGGFDAQYPINVDRALDFVIPTAGTVANCFAALKDGLPYVFRFETIPPQNRIPHPDLTNAQMALGDGPYTVRSVLQTAIAALPAAWQATALPSRVIIYRELDGYQYNTDEGGQVIARSQ
ncbi:MAG: GIY-YIG nuclease family protein [Acidobacteriota bacterium]